METFRTLQWRAGCDSWASLALALSLALVLAQSAAAGIGSRSAMAVSPGVGDRLVAIGDSCPTFNWGAADGAAAHELLVVELAGGEQAALADPAEVARPVLRQIVPGGALGWTPPLESCFRAGSAYAWFVRALGGPSGDPALGRQEWSEPLFFRVDPRQAVVRLLEGLSQETGAVAASVPAVRHWLEGVEAGRPVAAPPAASSAVASPGATTGVALSSVTGALNATAPGPADQSLYGVVGKANLDCLFGPSACSYGVGVYGEAAGQHGFTFQAGVYGYSPDGVGVRGIGGYGGDVWNGGVYGTSMSLEASGGRFTNDNGGIALEAQANGQGRTRAALVVDNYNANLGMAAYLTNHSQYATAHFSNSSWGEVLYLQNGENFFGGPGGPFIKAVNTAESDTRFLVDAEGAVWSDVGFSTPAADLAELLPAVEGLEPGDVLAIGSDGLLERSRRRGQRSVAGVYSSRPGFVGGQAASEPPPGLVPLAIAGIVPVKATSRGGPIRAGDLLVASSLPGHAMRARRGGRPGASLGRALEPLLASRGVIRMLVLSR